MRKIKYRLSTNKYILTQILVSILVIPGMVFSQDINIHDSLPFALPPILKEINGSSVDTPEKWFQIGRPFHLKIFEEQMYGVTPKNLSVKWNFIKASEDRGALEGVAIKKEIIIRVTRGSDYRDLWLLLYLPAGQDGPFPVFLGLNFNGNHSIISDQSITITPNWIDENMRLDRFKTDEIDRSRGSASSRWPVREILSRGYGLATIFYGDMDPDYDDGFRNGIHPLFLKEGQSIPGKDEWGSIGAWAWGISRAIDYFEKDVEVDASKVAVLGHSRLGKTALWAGATDERIAVVISNNSGCGGAALSIRKRGETIKAINDRFPHWFCDNFTQYNDQEEKLLFDQHILLALIAPRPVYVASAEQDLWADPFGEYLAAYYAQRVYELLGISTALEPVIPEVDNPVKKGTVGYHVRTGGHDLTGYDWTQFLDFTDLHILKEKSK